MCKQVFIILSNSHSAVSNMLKFFSHDEYTHVAISLDADLKQMYSFGRLHPSFPIPGGFIIEDKNTEISVADNWYDKPRNWIVTAYPKNKSAKKRFASSVPVQQNLDVKNGFSILNSLADNNIVSNSKDVFKGAYQKVLDKLNSIRQ